MGLLHLYFPTQRWLGEELEHYAATEFPKGLVKIVRTGSRIGLIRARMMGATVRHAGILACGYLCGRGALLIVDEHSNLCRHRLPRSLRSWILTLKSMKGGCSRSYARSQMIAHV